jgi:hypothetical protein
MGVIPKDNWPLTFGNKSGGESLDIWMSPSIGVIALFTHSSNRANRACMARLYI